MLEIRGDMFQYNTYCDANGQFINHMPDAICITTNGFIKRNGAAVMGRGCAHTAAKRWPGLALRVGRAIHDRGNIVHNIERIYTHVNIVTFPVKPTYGICYPDRRNVVEHMRHQFQVRDKVPGWACVANTKIIERSAHQLLDLTNKCKWTFVVLPRPGCGAGELNWQEVKPILDNILDDRFYCITFHIKMKGKDYEYSDIA